MGSASIKREMRQFQAAVKKLSGGIERASSIWKDEKYSELASSLREIAHDSRDVILAGDRSCLAIAKFDEIASKEV